MIRVLQTLALPLGHVANLGTKRAGNGTRTRDLLLGKEVFYQLNYARRIGLISIPAENAESQNRTGDTMIFSHVLYQLSYLGLNVFSLSKEPQYFTYMSGGCQAVALFVLSAPPPPCSFFLISLTFRLSLVTM